MSFHVIFLVFFCYVVEYSRFHDVISSFTLLCKRYRRLRPVKLHLYLNLLAVYNLI